MNLQHERIELLCNALSLPCVAQGYGAAAQQAAKTDMGYSDFLEGLLKDEAAGRRVRKQTMMTRLAGFPVIKTLDDFSYDFAKGVKKSQVEELAGLGFIERHEDENDRRQHNLTLTAAGRALLDEAIPQFASLETEMLAPLSLIEQETLSALMAKVVLAMFDSSGDSQNSEHASTAF